MLKIIRVDDDTFMLDGTKRIYGDTNAMIIAMSVLGVSWDEIERGLISLVRNSHHIAEYGINKSFLFSRRVVDIINP